MVKSRTRSNEPESTPKGKPVNEGVVVATPAFPGGATQQWMCDAVVPLGVLVPGMVARRLLKTTLTSRVCAVVSKVTNAKPVPREGVAGFSLAPPIVPDSVMIPA
jgi:hypothetical protein